VPDGRRRCAQTLMSGGSCDVSLLPPRRASLIAVASMIAAMGVGGVGLAGPAAAVGGAQLFAYADGAGTPSGCPSQTTSTAGCSLETALGDAAAGDTVLLATAGASAHYDGVWDLSTTGTTAADPVTIAAAAGVINPILDGDGAQGTMLDILNGASVTITAVTVTRSQGAHEGGDIDTGDASAGGTVTITDSTFTNSNATFDGGAIDNADNGGATTAPGPVP
jgi:hypothetical protein